MNLEYSYETMQSSNKAARLQMQVVYMRLTIEDFLRRKR